MEVPFKLTFKPILIPGIKSNLTSKSLKVFEPHFKLFENLPGIKSNQTSKS